MDWQVVAVVVIVASAVAYLATVAWRVVLGMTRRKSECATACGGCSSNESQSATPGPTLVRLTRSPRGPGAQTSHDVHTRQAV